MGRKACAEACAKAGAEACAEACAKACAEACAEACADAPKPAPPSRVACRVPGVQRARELKTQLDDPKYRNIDKVHRKKLIEYKTVQMAAADLERYNQALDRGAAAAGPPCAPDRCALHLTHPGGGA